MKFRAVAALLLLLSGIVAGMSSFRVSPAAIGDDKPAAPKKSVLQKFMQAKLDMSQALMEGLVTEDFDRLEKNAKALLLLSIAEEWKVSADPLYKQHSEEFRRAVKQIDKMAMSRNLDGASLSFVQMTMSCIECHRFVRNVLVTKQ